MANRDEERLAQLLHQQRQTCGQDDDLTKRLDGEIVEIVGFSQPTISHHLAILREAGLVNTREEGKQTFSTLHQERMASCCGNLVVKFAPGTETAEAVKATATATKDAAGVVVEKTGEVLEKAGSSVEGAGADMRQ